MQDYIANNFGKDCKRRLLQMGKTQVWLAGRVRQKTGQYVDAAYLQKIWAGKRHPPRIVKAIKEILQMEEGRHERW